MEITQASLSDIPDLYNLLEILFKQETEFKPDRETQIRGLSLIIKNPDTGNVFVARKSGKIIAMVSLLYSVSTALGERVAFLEDMIVSPTHRGTGTGSMLLKHAIKFAKEKCCGRITLLTDHDNEIAQGFYQGHGFIRSPMVAYRLYLEDTPAGT